MSKGNRANLESLLRSACEKQHHYKEGSPSYAPEDRSDARKEFRDGNRKSLIVWDIILFAVPIVIPMPVLLKWAIWFICWIALVWFVLPDWFEALNTLSRRTRRVALLICAASFILSFGPIAHTQWREEKAAAASGTLSMPYPHAKNVLPVLEIGDSSSKLLWTGRPDANALSFVWDAGLRIENGSDGELKLSTQVRDHQGTLLVEVDKNKWRFYCCEKNYTDHSLEVKDKRGHVILQIVFLSDRVRIQGEWRDEFGNGVRLISPGTDAGGVIAPWTTPQTELKLEGTIAPIFKYPSKDHWGEFVDGITK
jgi:hypothetical protein